MSCQIPDCDVDEKYHTENYYRCVDFMMCIGGFYCEGHWRLWLMENEHLDVAWRILSSGGPEDGLELDGNTTGSVGEEVPNGVRMDRQSVSEITGDFLSGAVERLREDGAETRGGDGKTALHVHFEAERVDSVD